MFGKITLILGSMFSGKSTELLKYAEKALLAKLNVCLIRPSVDTRSYISRFFEINKKYKLPIYVIDSSSTNKISELCGFDIILIDEAQFFEKDLCKIVHKLALKNKDIIISALSGDTDNNPWETVSNLIPYVDDIKQLNAVCVSCGEYNLGTFSFYDGVKKEKIVIGDENAILENSAYKVYCRKCWNTKTDLKQSTGNC